MWRIDDDGYDQITGDLTAQRQQLESAPMGSIPSVAIGSHSSWNESTGCISGRDSQRESDNTAAVATERIEHDTRSAPFNAHSSREFDIGP